MRNETFDICAWTRNPLYDVDVGSAMLSTLAAVAPDWFPLIWSSLEETEIESAADFSPVLDLWSTTDPESGFPLQGGRSQPKTSMLVVFHCVGSNEVNRVCLSAKLPPKEWAQNVPKALELLRRWSVVLGADYARVCAGNEWERKNVIEQYEEPDGSIDPWMVFQPDITTGLPGVYWGTYFGNAYVEWFGGRDRFEQAPWPHVERSGDGFLL